MLLSLSKPLFSSPYSFQNYIDDDSYTGYLVELNDIEDVE